MILKSYKYRIYPNQTQTQLIEKHFGCVRYIYNWALENKIKKYQKDKKTISCFELTKLMSSTIKKEKEWLNDVNSQSLQMSLRNLDNAFTNFFKNKTQFPRFRKKSDKQSFHCPQHTSVNFKEGKISVPKIKNIKTIFDREFKGKIKNLTISKNKSNKYFMSVLVESNENIIKTNDIKEETTIGLDLGIKDFAILSNGKKIKNPRFFKKSFNKIKKLQRNLNKKKKGSNNRKKAKIKLAKAYEKISNQRKDFLHKVSFNLTHDNQVNSIAIETLKPKNMCKNHNLSQSILDASWAEFITILEYKCNWYGKNLIRIGQFDPSSKTCSNCGWIKKDLTLEDRIWKCKDCSTKHDRDINAAKNIKNFALIKQNLLKVKNTDG